MAAAFALAVLASPLAARPAVDAIYGLVPVREAADRRCTADGFSCIGLQTYVADVCRSIEREAALFQLDKNFLARLLWKESLFEPGAVSPVGAEGIAQFMPGTAAIVGLHDPFNPAEAIHVSAGYLKRLSEYYGSIGIAAVAYNGGEARASRFMQDGGTLPYETQDYVEAITGFNAWRWREDPPAPDSLDLRLNGDAAFLPSCTKLAGNRELKEFATAEKRNPVSPWGVILGSHQSRNGVQSQVNRLNRQLRPLLNGKNVSYVRRTLRKGAPKVYTAQVGWGSRAQANLFCQKAKIVGISCIVLRN